MNGTCMKCDGCEMEVRVGGPGHYTAPDAETARAFGWEVGEQHLCPVCVETRDLLQQAQEQSRLILPDHVKRKPTPKHKLFAVPDPTPEQLHQQHIQTLSTHASAALAVVRDHLKPPQGICWNPGDGSPWRVVISREQEEAPVLPRAVH